MEEIFQSLNKREKIRTYAQCLFPHSSFYLCSTPKAVAKRVDIVTAPDNSTPPSVFGRSSVMAVDKIKILFVTDYFRAPPKAFNEEEQNLLNNIIKAMVSSPNQAQIEVIEQSSSRPDLKFSGREGSKVWSRLIDKIYSLQAKYIVTLGAFAGNFLLHRNDRLMDIRGRFYQRTINHPDKDLSIKILPLFHPSFLLINPSMKSTAWSDLQLILNNDK